MHVTSTTYSAPCGSLILGELEGKLVFCDWVPGRNAAQVLRRLEVPSVEGATPVLTEAVRQLDEYFVGRRQTFDLPLRLVGTPFRIGVWQGLTNVEYDRTLSYSTFASILGHASTGVRALASAVGANPFSIILPCHRIIGSDGSLRGYAGGLSAKRFLLDLEMSNFAL